MYRGDEVQGWPAGTKTGPFVRTGGELAFSFTIPLQGGMDIRTRLAAQGATLKGRWEDVKGGSSGPVELALANPSWAWPVPFTPGRWRGCCVESPASTPVSAAVLAGTLSVGRRTACPSGVAE